jgi:hypothetical protein
MKLLITDTRPDNKPVQVYETRMMYIGFKYRYNTHKKTLSSIEKQSDGSITFVEIPAATEVFARAYASENVRVTIYSESPRVWAEETSPYDLVVFREVTLQS